MKLFNIPLESLEERYSTQWNEWFPEEFKKYPEIEVVTVYPEPLSDKINQGVFLDIIGTNYFKSQQLSSICKLFENNLVKDGDVFFFHDIWFPGIEQLFYIRDGLGIRFKIAGMLHAGTYDPHDFLSSKMMGIWARRLEESWFNEIDYIFLATEFHKELLLSKRKIEDSEKLKVTSFPLKIPILEDFSLKENIVVFPHRINSEKRPELFVRLREELQKDYPEWKFLITKECCSNKTEYYDLLKRSKIAVSFALQETWGIAQQEAFMLGCIPVVPDALSYEEMYHHKFKYCCPPSIVKNSNHSFNSARTKVKEFMDTEYLNFVNTDNVFKNNRILLSQRNERSISKMITIMT